MSIMGPVDPSDEEVEEVLNKILDLLIKDYDCLTIDEKYTFLVRKDLREERVEALRKAVFGMLQLERWESW